MLRKGRVLKSLLLNNFDQNKRGICLKKSATTSRRRLVDNDISSVTVRATSTSSYTNDSQYQVTNAAPPFEVNTHVYSNLSKKAPLWEYSCLQCEASNTKQNDSDHIDESWWYAGSILLGLASASLGLLLSSKESVSASEKQTIDKKRLNLLLCACKDNDLEGIRKLLKDGVSNNIMVSKESVDHNYLIMNKSE